MKKPGVATCVYMSCFVLLFAHHARVAAETIDVTTFRERYTQGSADLQAKLQNIRVTGTLNARDVEGRVEFLALGDTVMRAMTATRDSLAPEGSQLDRGTAMVIRTGPDYRFRLTKRQHNEPYLLSTFTETGKLSDNERHTLAGERELRIEQFLKAHFFFYGKPIRDWLSRDDFQITSVATKKDLSGEETVEVAFNVTFPSGQRSDTARFIFAPALSWALKESEVRFTIESPGRTMRGAEGVRLSYASARAREQRYPDKIEIYQTDLETGKGNTQSLTVDAVEYGSVKPDQLTLSAFGLRDRNPSTPNRAGWWLWIALAGGGLLVLGVAFSWLKRRASK